MLKKILIGLIIVMLLAMVGFSVWANANMRPATEDAVKALNSTDDVSVAIGKWQVFTPTGTEPKIGFIFYPGGSIEEGSYAPTLAKIAAQGYLVVNVDMPLALAVLGSGQAKNVIVAYPEIETWVIGGHSLGGAMAANFVVKNPDLIDGLILWAAYPPREDDLTSLDLAVITIYGSLDGGAHRMERAMRQLPADSTVVKIEGGNHNQFGDYVEEPGDRKASIPREEQQAQILTATLEFLSQFED